MGFKTALIIVAILVVVAFLYLYNLAQAPENGVAINTAETNNVVVKMLPGAFSPSALSVKKETQITFVNKDTVPRWPASAVHPEHQCYPEFDSIKSIVPGESFSFTANIVKTCGFH